MFIPCHKPVFAVDEQNKNHDTVWLKNTIKTF